MPECGMLVKQLFQGGCFVDMGNYPQCMSEHLTIFRSREREVIFSVFCTEKIQELQHICFVYKTPFGTNRHRYSFFIRFWIVCLGISCPCTEELRESKYTCLVKYIVYILGDVISEDIHLRQFLVWILFIRMLFIPFFLSLLFCNVVPCVNFIFLEIFIEIEGCSGEVKHLGLVLLQEIINDAFPQRCSCALVRLVDNNKVPIGIENISFQFFILNFSSSSRVLSRLILIFCLRL